MKNARQTAILSIIERENIETQEELIRLLAEKGYTVTQATASRDIRELKLTKSTEGKQGSYHYVLPKTLNPSQVHFNKTIVQSITGVDYWGNLVVLKTIPGLASAGPPVLVGLCLTDFNAARGRSRKWIQYEKTGNQ